MNRFRIAESSGDDLLLLAIDRVVRSEQQDVGVADDRGSDDPRADNLNRRRLIDESLVAAIAEWSWVCGKMTTVRG